MRPGGRAAELQATAERDLARIDMAHALDRHASLVARASRELLLLETAGGLRKQRELIAASLAGSEQQHARLAELAGDELAGWMGPVTQAVDSSRLDEIGALLQAIGEMQQHLTRVIEDVHRAAREVAVGSSEIAQGNADLSRRTESASSSLQQTASAMAQMALTVGGSSEKSRQAAQVAAKAREAVLAGGQTIEGLVAARAR